MSIPYPSYEGLMASIVGLTETQQAIILLRLELDGPRVMTDHERIHRGILAKDVHDLFAESVEDCEACWLASK